MPAVLNTNVASLWASKNLLGAQENMANSVERLSSGLRINRARDDAAGLGVANALTAQINSANQGVRNLNDGISMMQTAEAAITAASDMGQRILTLATQGANATLGLTERKAIQKEMSKLLDAVDSIGTRTKFSGNELLGVAKSATASDIKYSLQISNERADKVNLTNDAFYNIGSGSSAATEYASVTFSSGFTSGQVVAVADGTVTRTITVGTGGATITDMQAMMRLGTAQGTNSANHTVADTGTGAVSARWTASAVGSNGVKFLSTGAGRTSANVDDLTMSSTGNPGVAIATTQGATAADAQASTLRTDVNDLLTLLTTGTDLTAIAEKFRDIQSSSNAYVVNLGTQRSLLGAYQNQIEYTVSNVTELSGNLSAARSRVQDTDYAAETANLTKGQILQQAATAMLAQANQMPNVILTLLK